MSVVSDSATPWTVAHQAPLSRGFSGQNTGVGCHALLQGIFPTQESKPGLLHCRRILYQLSYQGSPKSLSRVRLFVTPWSAALQAPLSMGILNKTRILEWAAMPPPGDLPNLGIKLRPSALLADSLPSEPPGKPTNTGMGSLSLLQGIFLTQESNQGLPHCRWILYKLSYQGSPCRS